MSIGSPGAASGEVDRLRQEYEASLSWRLTGPLRAAGRLGGARRARPSPAGASPAPPRDVLDSWLDHFYGDQLPAIDAACAGMTAADQPALFAALAEPRYLFAPHVAAPEHPQRRGER